VGRTDINRLVFATDEGCAPAQRACGDYPEQNEFFHEFLESIQHDCVVKKICRDLIFSNGYFGWDK